MKYSLFIKDKAIQLRKKGYSLDEISKKLKISKSTSSLWLINVLLDKNAKNRIENRKLVGLNKSNQTKKKNRDKLLKKYQKLAREDLLKSINKKSFARIICSILFWCEGNKNMLNAVRFTNSDPAMINCFLSLLRNGFEIDESKLHALVHLHNYHNEKRQLNYWSKITNISVNQFFKSYKKINSGKRIRNGYPGCIAIYYFDSNVAKKLWSYYKEMQKLNMPIIND